MLTYADVAHALLPGPEIAASTLVKPDVNTSLQKECLTVSSLFFIVFFHQFVFSIFL
jgi:hypothetical protein